MVDLIVLALREAARHRGYRLLGSKKRTAGVGDYGKFGLADSKGKRIVGSGPDGLTASAADIETYLRGSELETWKKLLKVAQVDLRPRGWDKTSDHTPVWIELRASAKRKPAKETS